MNTMTLNELDDELVATIRRVAERDKMSEKQAALKLLRKGAALEEEAPSNGKVGDSLKDVIGTWTKEEAEEFDAAVAELRVIDDSMWR